MNNRTKFYPFGPLLFSVENGSCKHLYFLPSIVHSWTLTTWYWIDSHFCFKISASPLQFSAHHHKWFEMLLIQDPIPAQSFFFYAWKSCFFRDFATCHKSYSRSSSLSSLIYFEILGCLSVARGSNGMSFSFNWLRHRMNPSLPHACELPASETCTSSVLAIVLEIWAIRL